MQVNIIRPDCPFDQLCLDVITKIVGGTQGKLADFRKVMVVDGRVTGRISIAVMVGTIAIP